MSASDPSKKLASLLKRLRGRFTADESADGAARPSWIEPLVDELIYSFLLWEATTGQARNAFKRLKDSYIDYNELRVSLPEETVSILGERYPRGEERAARMRATLFDLYKREFGVTLRALADGGKRDTRTYLESLEGIPTCVVDRMMVVGFGAHAVPTDERLRDLLADEGVVDPEMPAEEAAAWLSRQIKAEEAMGTMVLLRAWADEDSPEPRKPKAAPAKADAGDEPRGKARGKTEARPEGKAEERPAKRRPPARKKVGKGGDA